MITTRRLAALVALGLALGGCAASGPAAPTGPGATTSPASTAPSAPGAASPSTAPSGVAGSPGEVSTAPGATPSGASPSPVAERNPAPYVEGAPYAGVVDPASFGAVVDNTYFPLVPGTVTTFKGGDERIVVTVLDATRDILGVAATVVHDQAFVKGKLAEDTFDWYAQDLAGNVWYFGEATEELEGGKVTSTKGSWEAGVAGALPGIVMLADPRVGDAYRQEYARGDAEDVARVLEVGGSIKVAAGTYANTIVTEDWSPLELTIVEHKTYAPGVGVVGEDTVKGGNDRSELVQVTHG